MRFKFSWKKKVKKLCNGILTNSTVERNGQEHASPRDDLNPLKFKYPDCKFSKLLPSQADSVINDNSDEPCSYVFREIKRGTKDSSLSAALLNNIKLNIRQIGKTQKCADPLDSDQQAMFKLSKSLYKRVQRKLTVSRKRKSHEHCCDASTQTEDHDSTLTVQRYLDQEQKGYGSEEEGQRDTRISGYHGDSVADTCRNQNCNRIQKSSDRFCNEIKPILVAPAGFTCSTGDAKCKENVHGIDRNSQECYIILNNTSTRKSRDGYTFPNNIRTRNVKDYSVLNSTKTVGQPFHRQEEKETRRQTKMLHEEKKESKKLDIQINYNSRFGDINRKHCKAVASVVEQRLFCHDKTSCLEICLFVQDTECEELQNLSIKMVQHCLNAYFFPCNNCISVNLQRDLSQFLCRTIFQKNDVLKDIFGARHHRTDAEGFKAALFISKGISAMVRHPDVCFLETLGVLLRIRKDQLLVLQH